MIQIAPTQATLQLRALFDPADPASLRCFAVLNGDAAGKILTDDPTNPTWGVVQEAAFGTIYPSRRITAQQLAQVVGALRQHGEVLLGLWHDDPRSTLVPSDAEYDGRTLDITEREGDLTSLMAQMPDGCAIQRIDPGLFERFAGRDFYILSLGSAENALKKGLGYCLLREDEIVCEAFAAPAADGVIEIGTETKEAYRRRGYAAFTCATLIQACEALRQQTYWNCAKQNTASVLLARKLGYQREREYRLWAWSQLKS